jgi:hypothetical protein
MLYNLIMAENKFPLIDIFANSPESRARISHIVDELKAEGIVDIEEQVIALLKNMITYFSKKADIFPKLDELEKEDLEVLDKELKKISKSIMANMVKSPDELLGVVIFNLLGALSKVSSKSQNELESALVTKEQEENKRKILAAIAARNQKKEIGFKKLMGKLKRFSAESGIGSQTIENEYFQKIATKKKASLENEKNTGRS